MTTMKKKYMNEMLPGEQARIQSVATHNEMRQRFFDLGVIPGTVIECIGKSPANDPAAYLIRGAVIAIRGKDCGDIEIASV